MIRFVSEIVKELRAITPQSYYGKSTAQPVVFPYLTFQVHSEGLGKGIDGFYVDVDAFDSSTSYGGVLTLESELRAHLDERDTMLGDLFIRWNFLRSNSIETESELIKRRNMQFYCKIYWRDK